MAKTYGYVRISSKDQNESRQLDAMQDFGIQEREIFVDKLSGKDFKRPACVFRFIRTGIPVGMRTVFRKHPDTIPKVYGQ